MDDFSFWCLKKSDSDKDQTKQNQKVKNRGEARVTQAMPSKIVRLYHQVETQIIRELYFWKPHCIYFRQQRLLNKVKVFIGPNLHGSAWMVVSEIGLNDKKINVRSNVVSCTISFDTF